MNFAQKVSLISAGALAFVRFAGAAEPTPVPPSAPFTGSISPVTAVDAPGEKKVSDAAQAFAQRGTEALGEGDLSTAKSAYQKALQLAPGNLATTINLGLVEYRQKDFSAAEKLLQGAVRTSPETGLAWMILGAVETEQDKVDAALAALAQAAYLEPKNATVHQYFAVALSRKGWLSGAEDELRRALEIDPSSAEANFNLALLYLQRKPPSMELARRHYVRARELGTTADASIEKILNRVKP